MIYFKKILAIHTLVLAFAVISCDTEPKSQLKTAQAWNPINDPALVQVASKALQELQKEAALPENKVGVSDYYWPTYQGGISYRWQTYNRSSNYRDYLYPIIPENVARKMKPDETDRLSPSEKYDLWLGRFNFPLTQSERAKTLASVRDRKIPKWFGLCHGWAAASIYGGSAERPITVTSAQGLALNFTGRDINALLARVYSDVRRYDYQVIGARCETKSEDIVIDINGRILNDECRDINPGAFHLILAEFIGRRQQSFMVDVDPSEEVWNYPVTAYKTQYSEIKPLLPTDRLFQYRAPGTAYTVEVYTVITLLAGATISSDPLTRSYGEEAYRYTLELDKDQKIIGGEWSSRRRPDFLWVVTTEPGDDPDGLIDYKLVKELLKKSQSEGQPIALPVDGNAHNNLFPINERRHAAIDPASSSINTRDTAPSAVDSVN